MLDIWYTRKVMEVRTGFVSSRAQVYNKFDARHLRRFCANMDVHLVSAACEDMLVQVVLILVFTSLYSALVMTHLSFLVFWQSAVCFYLHVVAMSLTVPTWKKNTVQ